jgi:hypothetical protein
VVSLIPTEQISRDSVLFYHLVPRSFELIIH